jgi:hypothetical protein
VIEGRVVADPNKSPTADGRIVSTGFFKTLGVPLVRGRVFTDADDRETQPVIVINKAMMRYWDARGASRQTVLQMVVREGLALVAVGLVIGGVGAVAVTRVLATYLFDTKPTDPFTFTMVGIAFVVAGASACLGPAWRATTVDPTAALRVD